MTTHLDEINVYLDENRMEIKSKSSNPSFASYALDYEESMLSEVKTCTTFRLFYNKESSLSKAIVADLRLTKVLPKLQSIDVFYCSVQPSDVLKFLNGSPVKIRKLFDFMHRSIPESEKDDLSTLMIDYTEEYIGTFGINFPHLWLWDYYKSRGERIYVFMVSQSELIEYFNKIFDEGIPLCDPEGSLCFYGNYNGSLEYFNCILPQIIKRGTVRIDTKQVGEEQIFDMELKKADDKKLFVKIDNYEITFSNRALF